MQGLPGSGKTTCARQIMTDILLSAQPSYSKVTCVSQDEIRKELFGWTSWATYVWDRDKERLVTAEKTKRIAAALAEPRSFVVSDDTNLNPAVVASLRTLAKDAGADVEIIPSKTSIAECIRRDALRGAESVGAKVIRDMGAKYGLFESPATQTQFAPVTADDRLDTRFGTPLQKAVICDLDGTLSLFKEKGHRGPYDATLCDQDDVNRTVLAVLRAMQSLNLYSILYVSGRFDTYREPTLRFFDLHAVPPGPLWMRKAGDTRKDWIVKGEIFNTFIRHQFDVRLVLDDRTQVVDFWRSIGLECWQVAKGDF